MLIQRRRLTILPSSQDVSEEKRDGLTECPARGKHTMHDIVAFMILWLILLPVIYLIEALLCSLVHQCHSGFAAHHLKACILNQLPSCEPQRQLCFQLSAPGFFSFLNVKRLSEDVDCILP